MSSDWHIGHKNIHKFRCKEKGFPIDFNNELEHREWLFDWINDNIKKRDVMYLLGDIAFDEQALLAVGKLPGRKILIKGNHCTASKEQYKVYEAIHGLTRYKHVWLSHCPIIESELRGRPSLHGHTHYININNPNYFNCCIENLWRLKEKCLIGFEEIKELIRTGKESKNYDY